MSLLKKLQTIPAISKFMINRYAPYHGAGIEIEKMDLANYHIRVKMPLTRKNQNVVGGAFWRKLVFHGRSVFYAFTDASSRIKIYRLG